MATREEILRLKVEAEGEKDLLKLADGLEQLEVDGKKAETATGKLVDELAKLEKQSRAAAEFERLSASVDKTAAKLLEAKAALEKLNTENAGTEKRTKEVAAAFKAAEKEVKGLESQQTKLTGALQKSGEALRAAGVDTTKLASEQARLAAESKKSEQTIQQQAAALRANAAAAEASAARWKAYGDSLKNARERGNELVGNLARVGAAATAAAAAAAVYAGAKFFTGGIEDAAAIEQALARIQSAAGLTADELATVQTAIEQTAVAASRDVGEAAIAFEALSREGSTAAEAIGALKPALDFATAANLSAKDAVAALSGALDAFGLSADQTATAADTIAAAALKGGTGIADLTAALAKAGPGARGLGLDLQTTTAALAALAQAGIEGGRAGSAFLKIIDDLADPTSRLSEALTEAGITSRDFATVLAQLDAKGVGAEKVFASLRTNGSAALRALAQNGGAALTQIRTSLDDTAGATERAAAAINDTYTVALANLGRAFEAARVELVKPLLGPLSDELDKLTAAIAEFAQSDAFAKLQVDLVTAFGIAAGAAKDFAGAVDFDALAGKIGAFAIDSASSLRGFADEVGPIISGMQAAFDSLLLVFGAVQTGVFALAQGAAGIAKFGAEIDLFNQQALLARSRIAGVSEEIAAQEQKVFDAQRRVDGLTGAYEEFGQKGDEAAERTRAALERLGGESEKTAPKVAAVGVAFETINTAAAKTETTVAEVLTGVDRYVKTLAGATVVATNEIISVTGAVKVTVDTLTEASVRAGKALQEGIASGASTDEIKRLEAAFKAANDALAESEKASAGASTAMSNLANSSEEAGKKTKANADKARESLGGVTGEANEAANAIRGLGDASDQAADSADRLAGRLDGIGQAAKVTSVQIAGISDEYARLLLVQSEVKLGPFADPNGRSTIEAEFDRQSAAIERATEAVRRQNAAYDDIEKRLISLRSQYSFLSEDRLRQLAQEQEALDRNREAAARDGGGGNTRPPNAPPNTPTPAPRPGGGSGGGLTINVNVSGSIIGASPSRLAEELARIILPEIRKLEARGF